MKCTSLLGLGLLLALPLSTGCDKPTETKPAVKVEDDHAVEHSHGSGPNGGVVFDLGSHHVEFTVDHGKQECTILVLGEDEKSPAPVAAEEFILNIKDTETKDGTAVPAMTVVMKAVDAADGKAAKFVGTDPGIGNVADFEGTVSGEIDGKPASGEFKE